MICILYQFRLTHHLVRWHSQVTGIWGMGFSDTLLRERESVWLSLGVKFPPGDGNRVKDVKEGSGVVNQDNAVISMI